MDPATLSFAFNVAAQVIGYGTAAVAALLTARSGFFINKQQQESLITRFGKHTRTVQDPGLHLKVPFIDKIAKVLGTDLLQASEKLATKTKDDLFVELPITVQYQLADSAKFYFKNRDAGANMMKLVSAAVRTATSGKDFQDLYTDRDELSNAVIAHIQKDVDDFGLAIRRIVIDEPTAPAAVQNAFNEVRASERLKEAARNKAEANRIEVVTRAEAQKEADVLHGEGKAGFRKKIFDQYREQIDALSGGDPARREEAIAVMMQAMHQDTLRDVGEKGNLVIVTEGGSSGGTHSGIAQAIAQMQTLRAANDVHKQAAPPAAAATPAPGG